MLLLWAHSYLQSLQGFGQQAQLAATSDSIPVLTPPTNAFSTADKVTMAWMQVDAAG